MSLTPETLTRHELCGLHVEVVESTDPSRVGIAGRVVRETMQTLVIEADDEGSSGVLQVERSSTERASGDTRKQQVERSSTERANGHENGVLVSQPERERSGDGVNRKQVPKRGTVFEFRLTDESAATHEGAGTASEPVSGGSHTAGYGAAYVTVDGVELLSRPALRSETGVTSKWQ